MTSAVFPKAPPGARMFRSGAARFGGWAWMVFAAANLADLIWRGRDAASLVAATLMLLGSGIAYVVALRPCVIGDDTGVRLHNLLRDVHVPWSAVRRIDGDDAVYVHTEDRRFRAFVLQTSPRARARAQLKARREETNLPDPVAEYVRGRTPTDFAVEQLRDMAEEHSRDGDATPAEPTVTWSWPAILALAVPAAAFAAALVIALT